MDVSQFSETLRQIRFKNAFNPYVEECEIYDIKGAAANRLDYLSQMLQKAVDCEVESLWVGRDLGYRGGRRTGLALTDDVHFCQHLERWGLEKKEITFGASVAERTAGAIWEVVNKIKSPIFMWNIFPLHPHAPGKPFSNRSHNSQERDAGLDLLSNLIFLLQPQRVIAIGNDAYVGVQKICASSNVFKVRHPSYGGIRDFNKAMAELYPKELTNRQHMLF